MHPFTLIGTDITSIDLTPDLMPDLISPEESDSARTEALNLSVVKPTKAPRQPEQPPPEHLLRAALLGQLGGTVPGSPGGLGGNPVGRA